MAVVKIESFGGELPSVSARVVPPNGAVTNKNLFLATPEFRPQLNSSVITSAPLNTKSIHRIGSTWLLSTADRNYVKGQINDEATERTYYTANDGSAQARSVDNTGADRELGVYRPVKPTAEITGSFGLTADEANRFLYEDVPELIRAAIEAMPQLGEPGARYTGTVPSAGPYSKHNLLYASQVGTSDHWNLYAQIPEATVTSKGFDTSRLGMTKSGTNWLVPITCLPYRYVANQSTLTAALQAILLPDTAGDNAGSQLLTSSQISALYTDVADALDPEKLSKTSRVELDDLVAEFYRLLFATTISTVTQPVQSSYTYTENYNGTNYTRALPTTPTGAIYLFDGSGNQYKNPAWTAYEAKLAQYNTAVAEYERLSTQLGLTVGSLNTRIKEVQDRAAILTREIEAGAEAAWGELTDSIDFAAEFVRAAGGVSDFIEDVASDYIESRFYVVTFVTDRGEESAPSEPSDMLEVRQTAVVTITRPNSTKVGSALAGANIQRWRIYRSNTGSSSTQFQFVDELLTSVTTYEDKKTGEELAEACPSITWEPPPYRNGGGDIYPPPVSGTNPYLRGLVGLPNGIMAGFFDNTVAFCEPYVPYAWPVEYQITTEHKIVGLGVFGQTVFVGTQGNPYFISGADSASMSAQKLDAAQACTSARSIVAVEGGVLFASPDGLCVADATGVKVISAGIYTREDWQKLTPSSMFASSHENIYYLWYTGSGGGCITFDLASRKLGRLDQTATAAYVDKLTDTIYVVSSTSLVAIHGAGTRRTGVWKSGLMTMPQQAPMAWLKVYGDQSAEAPAIVRWYGDGALRHTATLTSTNPVRLPSGRWLEHQIEIESAARVTKLVMAGSTQELQSL